MPFNIIQGDIRKVKADAIVNAANTKLEMGGGVCGAIFKEAGEKKLKEACGKLSPIKTGEAVITPGFDLPAKYIIHAAGPVYKQLNKKESERYLYLAYRNSLKLAIENECKSIAFPLISSGIYGYPKDEALRVATTAIKDFLKDHELDVTLVIYDKKSFSISEDLLESVEEYIDENYISMLKTNQRKLLDIEKEAFFELEYSKSKALEQEESLNDWVENLDESFSQMLMRLIEEKGMTDVEVYKAANMDRKLFSKIRRNKNYRPSKPTVLALAISLELSLDQTDDLLESAGFALSHAIKFDVIIEYFIINSRYDIFEINEVLFEYDQPLLGV